MKKILFTTAITLVTILMQGTAYAQTLWNGTGHIPTIYQQTWTKAGLLSDGNAITPKAVFNVPSMPGGAKIDTAINSVVD